MPSNTIWELGLSSSSLNNTKIVRNKHKNKQEQPTVSHSPAYLLLELFALLSPSFFFTPQSTDQGRSSYHFSFTRFGICQQILQEGRSNKLVMSCDGSVHLYLYLHINIEKVKVVKIMAEKLRGREFQLIGIQSTTTPLHGPAL